MCCDYFYSGWHEDLRRGNLARGKATG